jgi:hypothetical protein
VRLQSELGDAASAAGRGTKIKTSSEILGTVRGAKASVFTSSMTQTCGDAPILNSMGSRGCGYLGGKTGSYGGCYRVVVMT